MCIVVVFFFFKQKTAYEMRISDWSSDVCSSDLVFLVSYFLDRRRSGRLADASIEGLAASYSNAGFMGIPLCLMLFGEASLPPVIITTLLTACVLFAFSIVLIEIDLLGSPHGQIGRASCRERVCQYVWFSVVAVL